MKTHSDDHVTGSISRRSFFRLTMGSIALLPTVASALALPPEVAYAEEDGPHAELSSGSTIYVVSPRELGLVVCDVSQEDGSANLVKGAYVKITSRFNGAMVDGTTDDYGAISFDISDLAEDEGKQGVLARYCFNATIEVSAEGYREFRTNLLRIEGGTTLGIPTQPTQSGIPYPKCTSFDEWDVLYTTGDAATFVSCTGNDVNHTIDVSLCDCPAGAAISAELYCDGTSLLKTSAKATSDGAADLSFSGSFLRSDSSSALPIGEDHSYTLRYTANNTTYEVPIKLEVCEAPPEAQTSQVKEDLNLTPFNCDKFKLGFDVPKDWPLIGGSKFKLWEPSFPIWASFDPFGFARLRITSPEFGYVNDYGKPDKSGWQVCSRKGVKDQFTDAWNKMGNQTMDTFDSMTRVDEDSGKQKTFRQTSFAGRFTFTEQLEALAMATWSFDDNESRGRAQVGIRLGANYSLTEQFWAGPFPIIIRFGIGLNVIAAGMIGFVGPSIWKPGDWRWDYTSTGVDVQICFPPTLAVGMGIAGVASISVRGSISVTFSLHCGPKPAGFEHLDSVHLRLAAFVGLTLEAEALFFTYSWKITDKDWPDWYDNWKSSALNEGSSTVSPLEGLSAAQVMNQGKIITESALEALAEFETSGLLGMNPQEGQLVGYALFEHSEDGDTLVAQMFLTDAQVTALASESGVKLEANEQSDVDDAAPVPDQAETTVNAQAEANGQVVLPESQELEQQDADVDAAMVLGTVLEAVEDTADDGEAVEYEGQVDLEAEDGEVAASSDPQMMDDGALQPEPQLEDDTLASDQVIAQDDSAGSALIDEEAQPEPQLEDDVETSNQLVAQDDSADAALVEETAQPEQQAEDDAEESDELTALGDETEATLIIRPMNEEITYFESAAADASPVGYHNYVEIYDEAPGVLALGLEQGFRPTTDIRMAENVLSSSHLKLITVGGSDYIVRLCAVIVAGNVRTRVICEEVSGRERRVLDFVSSYGRDDCFDYDFDIASTMVGGSEVVNMVVISGTREQGDGTSFAHAASQTFFSFVSCNDWASGAFTGVTVTEAAMDAIGDGGKTYPYRNYSCPRLVQIKGTKDGVEYGQAAVAYLERASMLENEIMGTDYDLTRTGVGFIFFSDDYLSVYVDGIYLMRACMGDQIKDPSITEIALSGRADGHQMLELKGSNKTHYVLLETDPCAYVLGGHAVPLLLDVSVVDLGAYEGKISRLTPMESGSYFLTCVDGMLKRADVSSGPSLVFTDFDGAELNMSDFGVLEGGDVLYWSAARENGGYTFDDEGSPRLREDEEGAVSLIMAARVLNGKLSRAFALCEVGHTINRIRHYGNSYDHMSFISSSTVDLEAGKGEQWYTAVPWVRCANLLEAQPYDTMLARGDHLPFYVALRNDGNCYLTGVELTVAEVGGSVVGTMRLDFGEDTMVASEWNPLNEDGTLENVEDDWALAPGTTSRYLASYVTIPESWEGVKEIEVYVTAAYGLTVHEAGSLYGLAGDPSIEYLPDQRVESVVRLSGTTFQAGEYEELELTRADVTVLSKPDGGKKDDSGGSGNGKNGGKLPKTDDPTRAIAQTAALVAAGGVAGLAAGASLRVLDESEKI